MATKGFLEVQLNVDGIEPSSRFSSRCPLSKLQVFGSPCPDFFSNSLTCFPEVPFSLSLETWKEAFSFSSEITGEEGLLALGFLFAEADAVLDCGSLPIFPLVLELLCGLRATSLHLGDAVGTLP